MLVACAGEAPPYAKGPTLSQTSRIATHNSYYVNHGVTSDWFATGVGERVLDQLLLDHVRGLEFDIHPDPAAPHHFLVYHTVPGDGVCVDLESCLLPVQLLNDLVPSHSAVLVILELKGLATPTFDADHTPADLDATLRTILGASLYAPGDYQAGCATDLTPAACVAERDWPLEAELAGRVLVAVLGNWNDFPGAQAPADWALYALHADVMTRAAFSMGSSWQRQHTSLSELNQSLVDAATWERAWAQTTMLQVEAWDDPLLLPALAHHQLVRADNVFTAADRAQATALGVQLWQTDWPWDVARLDFALAPLPGAPSPSASLDVDGGVDAPLPNIDLQPTHVWLGEPSASQRAYVATALGLADGVTACLSAAVKDNPAVDGASWCVSKHAAPKGGIGKDAPADPLGETLTWTWQACTGGACKQTEVAQAGEATVLDIACTSDTCCATAGWLQPGLTVKPVEGAHACWPASSLRHGLFARWPKGTKPDRWRVRWVGGIRTPLP